MGVSIMEALRRAVRSIYVKIPTELSVSGNRLFLSHNGTLLDEGIEYNPGGGTGGGSAGYVTLKNLLYSSNITAAHGSAVELKFSYSTSEETDDGTASIFLDDVLKNTVSIKRGENAIDITQYLRSGTNNIKLTCSDPYGNERSLKYTVSIVSLSLTTNFSDSKAYTEDYFERAKVAMEKTDDIEAVRQGIELIYSKFVGFLAANDVKAIDTTDADFNTDLHEAITTFAAGEDKKGKVIDCTQKGYTLGEKVIRFSKVVVGE